MWKGLTNVIAIQGFFQDIRLRVMAPRVRVPKQLMRIPALALIFGHRSRPSKTQECSLRVCPSSWCRKDAAWLDDKYFRFMQKDGEWRLNTDHSVARSSIDLARPLSPPLDPLRSFLLPYHAILSPRCCCCARCPRRHRPCRRRDAHRAHDQPVNPRFSSGIDLD